MNEKVVVVLGASVKQDRYANKAQRLLTTHGYRVIPVHPLQQEIEGIPVVKDLAAVTETVDTVTVYLNPAVSKGLAKDLIALKPRRVIFNPGTESVELQSLLREQGILVEEACTLVLLGTGQF